MKRLGPGSRATFVSPYLRRPLRPLDKVLSERSDAEDEGVSALYGEVAEAGDEAASWHLLRKPAAASD